jgi:hypothetical protein
VDVFLEPPDMVRVGVRLEERVDVEATLIAASRILMSTSVAKQLREKLDRDVVRRHDVIGVRLRPSGALRPDFGFRYTQVESLSRTGPVET